MMVFILTFPVNKFCRLSNNIFRGVFTEVIDNRWAFVCLATYRPHDEAIFIQSMNCDIFGFKVYIKTKIVQLERPV